MEMLEPIRTTTGKDGQESTGEEIEEGGGDDNDLILYKLDSSYIHIKRSTFQETKLTENIEKSKEIISKLNTEMDGLNNQMTVLKESLYSKFGS
ncbi:hypothetical protein MJO29_008348 [Puccinia striiformis f. sp. tritici]|nr:hypothetical protein MJO29_008348 [Puccinia striiformis f. sp. tritici]